MRVPKDANATDIIRPFCDYIFRTYVCVPHMRMCIVYADASTYMHTRDTRHAYKDDYLLSVGTGNEMCARNLRIVYIGCLGIVKHNFNDKFLIIPVSSFIYGEFQEIELYDLDKNYLKF